MKSGSYIKSSVFSYYRKSPLLANRMPRGPTDIIESTLLPIAVPAVLISWSFKFAVFHFVLRRHAVRNSNLLDWIVR